MRSQYFAQFKDSVRNLVQSKNFAAYVAMMGVMTYLLAQTSFEEEKSIAIHQKKEKEYKEVISSSTPEEKK